MNGRFKAPAVCDTIEEEKKGNSFCGFLLWVKNWILINVHGALQVKARIVF